MAITVGAKHFCNIGDMISAMIALKKYHEKTGIKVNFYQQIDVQADYYAGATHPTLDSENRMVMCNKKMWDMVKPLILSQEYISDADVYNGQHITIDTTIIRGNIFVNMPHQAIQQWLFIAFPDLATDISKPWVFINEKEVSLEGCALFYSDNPDVPFSLGNLRDKIIINFTERYRNHAIDYFFLKKYQDKIIFSGTDKEYLIFTKKWGLQIPYLIVNDFLQLASILKQCKFVLSNQSFIWNLCEAIKIPRILELCQYAANCQAFVGEKSYGFLNQTGLQFYFHDLNGTIPEYIESLKPPQKIVEVED